MITPQTNTTLEHIAEELVKYDTFAICGHVNPDGDCLGSQLALAAALRSLGKQVTGLLAKTDPIDKNLLFLDGVDELVVATQYSETPDVFIAVDVPNYERIGLAVEAQKRAGLRVTIDHHPSDISMSELNYVDPDAASCSTLVWQLAKCLGATYLEVAQPALCGLITDTGRFSYQNTNPECFVAASEMTATGASPVIVAREFFQNRTLPSLKLERIALERMQLFADGQFSFSYLSQEDFQNCGAIKADAEPLIDVLRSVAGVKLALILRQIEPGEVRGSFRAKDDNTDVARIARMYDGGGHKAAAGFTFYGTLEDAVQELPQTVLREVFGQEVNA